MSLTHRMTKSGRKQARREAIAAETRKRENSLGVPTDKQVYVFQQHFSDAGGPRDLTIAEFASNPNHFDFDEWRQRIQSAPSGWNPVEVIPDHPPDIPAHAEIGDYCEFGGLSIFSQRAADSLAHLLSPCGLLLPLRCSYGPYVAYRLDATLDALDTDITRASWWPGGKANASSIYSYAFHSDKLGPYSIFRVPQHFEQLVLQEFVDIVRSNGFKGFRFCRVWPSLAGLWWHDNWC